MTLAAHGNRGVLAERRRVGRLRCLLVLLALCGSLSACNRVYQAPDSAYASANQRSLAHSFRKLVASLSFRGLAGRRVYIPARDPEHRTVFEAWPEADAWCAQLLTERLVGREGAEVVDSVDHADVALFYYLEATGTAVTHREWRAYLYPIYLQDEVFAPVVMVILGYDLEQQRFFSLTTGRAFAVYIESYFLDLFQAQIEW